jgi:excisionase family DNA binding protein
LNELNYTPEEVAKMLKISERTVRRWVREGNLEAMRYGRQVRISAQALQKFGKDAKITATDPAWLAKCRSVRAIMPNTGSSTELLHQIRAERADRWEK